MVEYYAKGLDLLCLMNLNPTLEPVPEPFRLQPSVALRVTFQAYIDFVNCLPTDEESIRLAGDLLATKDFARIQSPLLYNCFLRDMAFALAKELHFAEKYKGTCTLILPSSDTARTLSNKVLNANFLQHCSAQEQYLRNIANSYGFEVPQYISPQNVAAYRIAVYLLYLSGKPGVSEYNYSSDVKGMCENF